MIIEGEDYRLIPVDECSGVFNLELLTIINKGKENESKKFKPMSFGLPLGKALERICHFRAGQKAPKGDLELYMEEYKSASDKITKMCNI
jgi:hypothetical protein